MRFSGHESFHCRSYWLKKGVDFKNQSLKFPDAEAPIHLGVGKNMVASIRYWLKAFGLMDDDEVISPLAERIFGEAGWDPYLEDEGTLWLLHYLLVSQDYATIYNLVFNELRRKRPTFSQTHFKELVLKDKEQKVSPNTLKTDFQAFGRTYLVKTKGKDLDDNFSGIFTELGLINEIKNSYEIESKTRLEIPDEILLYCILESNTEDTSISFDVLYNGVNSVGRAFAISQEGLNLALESINESFAWVTYSNEAGIRELQIKKKPKSNLTILEGYYGS